MRKRIQQLARGKFEYARPLLSFSTEKVDIEVLEGRDYTGDFVITSTNHAPFRGIIYTSDSRMECLTPQFEGEEVRIRYQFHSNGLIEGDIVKGDFFLICNQGEYNLSFVASISRLYADTSIGRVKSLGDFARLAEESAAEAYHLFFSRSFPNILKTGEWKERLLYDGLSDGAASEQRVEEYLLGIGRKKKVEVTLEDTDASFDGVSEDRREIAVLHRAGWGYIDIHVQSDAEFLVPEKEHLTEEDFIGSVCNFEYYIRMEAMHGGNNFGRLLFELPDGTLTLSVCARNIRCAAEPTQRKEVQIGRVRLTQLYIDYRLKKIVTGAWANQSIEILDHLMALEPESELYPLMKAQALIVNKQRQEAAWIMEDFKRNCIHRESPEWGYYLYLCTLMEREPSYVDRLADEMELLFKKNPESPLLFWVLLFVREAYYRNNSRKYKAIEQWIGQGCKSPYFYLEAYYLIWQDPYLLGKLDSFEIEVLYWARKQGVISKEIAGQVMQIVPELKEFEPKVYQILEACYQVEPSEEMLSVICTYLIRGQCYETKYHRWYELGIEQKIRITSLYEAYLMSLDAREISGVPRMLQMYFQYASTLSYPQKAVLFVNIIAAREQQPEVYQKYLRTMEQFAMEQMEAGHISDHLAVVYDEMLDTGILNEELAHRLAPILFTHRLICANRRISRAIILHDELLEPQVVPFTNGEAYFQAYTENYCVVLENTRGNRFCNGIAYQDEPMMHAGKYAEKGLALAPNEFPYLLYHMSTRRNHTEWNDAEQAYAVALMQSEKLGKRYRASLTSELITYYQSKKADCFSSEEGIKVCLNQPEAVRIDVAARRHLVSFLTECHMYDKAYQMIQVDGYDYLGAALRVALCSYAVTENGYEEDDFLLGFAESTFALGKYNDVLLIYLCKYYNGPTKQMAALWKAAGEFQIDTFDLEERILTQMLYTTDYTPYAEQIYDSYYAGGGRELICLAYLSYFAHMYLTQDAVVPGHVFLQIRERYLTEQELNDACRLGLLKHLAEKKELTQSEFRIADGLLAEYTAENLYFAFYRKFDERLIRRYHLYDKFFLEYHAAPGKRILVHFRMEEEDAYQTEELSEMYDGIYVREFILFFGESVQYYITEDDGPDEQLSESACISNGDILENGNQGRYAKLNDLLLLMTLEDGEKLKGEMKGYFGLSQVTEEAFKLL